MTSTPRPGRFNLSRRELMARGGALAAGAWVSGLPAPLIRRAAAEGFLHPVSMAMHVHSSFSEGMASMATHLDQATRNAVDVIWWTDHDWRMAARRYREVVHFDSLTSDREYGRAWEWVLRRTGSATIATGDLSTAASAPADPSPIPLGLALAAMSSGPEPASVSLTANTHMARLNLRGNLDGLRLHFEVFPQRVGRLGYLEVAVPLSYHPASGGRPAGQYRLSYRIGGAGAPGDRQADGLTGVATLATTAEQWNSVSVSPAADIARIWPDLDGRDMALGGVTLAAHSSAKALATGFFDYLRFDRSVIGAAAQHTQADLVAGYRSAYPRVTQHAAMEISLYDPHINSFGGAQHIPDYGDVDIKPGRDEEVTAALVGAVHAGAGITSYNHPFGSDAAGARLGSDAQQQAALTRVATALINGRALGAKMLEVGYPRRGGVTMARHIAAWDACSRNAIFLTANGVTDDHTGTDWSTEINRWITTAWAPSRSEPHLLAAMRAGRAYTGDMVDFTGTLDLLVDGHAPMGSVLVDPRPTHLLAVLLTGAPSGGAVRILQGTVDYAGAAAPDTNARLLRTIPAAQISGGRTALVVDGSAPSYLRVEILGADGQVVALSNPVWCLRTIPPLGIPTARRV